MMETILPSDHFQIENDRPLSNIDVEILTDLYLPIIGSNALSLYLKLFRYKEDRSRSHNALFEGMGMSPGNFLSSRKKLEGMSLLETRLIRDSDNYKEYLYILKSPTSGKDFLTSPLLRNQLLKSTSEDYLNWCDVVYKLTKTKRIKGGKDISMDFSSVYQADEIKDMNATMIENSSSKKRIKTYFDISKTLEYLSENNPIISKGFFTRSELEQISDLAASYCYNEEAAADILESSINLRAEQGKRIDFEAFKKDLKENQNMSYMKVTQSDLKKGKIVVHGTSDEARMIREMERMTPEEFLSKKAGGGILSNSDLTLIETLREMGLANPLINALLDYVLEIKDGSLPNAYVTKIAGSLARKGFDNSIDAYDYLHRDRNKKTSAPKQNEPLPIQNEPSKKQDDDDSILDLLGDE